jgi:hypothetical protein
MILVGRKKKWSTIAAEPATPTNVHRPFRRVPRLMSGAESADGAGYFSGGELRLDAGASAGVPHGRGMRILLLADGVTRGAGRGATGVLDSATHRAGDANGDAGLVGLS